MLTCMAQIRTCVFVCIYIYSLPEQFVQNVIKIGLAMFMLWAYQSVEP